jgi:hypothetical protein
VIVENCDANYDAILPADVRSLLEGNDPDLSIAVDGNLALQDGYLQLTGSADSPIGFGPEEVVQGIDIEVITEGRLRVSHVDTRYVGESVHKRRAELCRLVEVVVDTVALLAGRVPRLRDSSCSMLVVAVHRLNDGEYGVH